ncbi:hypothetical protein Tco_1005978 [Tanacetum coccineum]|uniref:Uncharacterized protein n=1 Tax=Tanacetum coccineum TaxID=301880 RepID=A0ABQ5FHL4_9ASTR
MFLNMDQLEKQLDKDEFQEIRSMEAFKVLETQCQNFIKSRISLDDEDGIMTRKYFLEYTQLEVQQFHDTLIQHMESIKKLINKRALHKREYDSRVNERQMQTTEEKVDTRKALDVKSAFVKPHHVIASTESESSSKNMPRFSSNDMVHNHYLEEAKKKTQEQGRNSRPSVMPSAKSQSTATCTSINVQEEQNLDLSAGTPFNLKKKRIKTWIKENVIFGRPMLHQIALIQEISARQKSQGI